MTERDDWKLGDESARGVCSMCGQRNRSGQTRCIICGTELGDAGDDELAPLRTISEAMAGARSSRRRGRRAAHSWIWPAAAIGLVAVVVAAYRIAAPLPRHLTLDEGMLVPQPSAAASPVAGGGAALAPAAGAGLAAVRPPAREPVVATPIATPHARVAVPSPAASLSGRVTVVGPAGGTASGHPRTPAAVPGGRERAGSEREGQASAPPPASDTKPPTGGVPPASSPAERSVSIAPPNRPQGGEEKPSLGSDLVAARRAYAAAMETYNARADEYNAIADAYQRREGRADPEELASLRPRLERARTAAERARAEAETLRARMEEVQAKYR